jgi:pimeloyl-ACP methyl ester carboxylesterase
MTGPEARTLDAPGATLHYDIRRNDAGAGPVLLLIGSPMGADGFDTQAGHFTDRTVVTYDPRGAGRSKRTDGASETAVEEHADDLRLLIDALGTGPADIFASSGGAVNALVLVAGHPEHVRVLVAHEAPATQEMPDCEEVLAVCDSLKQTYLRDGYGPAMAKFIALVSVQGPVPAGFADEPAPDPAAFGLPATDDGSRDDPLLGLNMPWCTAYQHDIEALQAAPARIVIGVGAQSADALAGRAAIALARKLGIEPVTFPGGHDGFLGSEFGRQGEPGPFAATLRAVLSD